MSDTTIGVPKATTVSERHAEDDTTVSVHIQGQAGWSTERLAPGEAMDIQLPSGEQIAIVEVDEEDDAEE